MSEELPPAELPSTFSGWPPGRLQDQLGHAGLVARMGPFAIRLRVPFAPLVDWLQQLYAHYPVLNDEALVDLHVGLGLPNPLRRWIKPTVRFTIDGRSPFPDSPANQALPTLEWGINWGIATRANHLLMLHCAAIERDGRAILFPAWPGHGKSTLCTALVHSGWRLLSDEFGLIRPEDSAILPIPRLIPLKNESIEVIRSFAPQAFIGPSFHGTRKGTVAHVRPPAESVERQDEVARPGWLVFPRWVKDAPLTLEPMPKAQSFLMVATNAFNYEVLGETAFRLVGDMVRTCECFSLTYSDLDEAVTALDRLTRDAHG